MNQIQRSLLGGGVFIAVAGGLVGVAVMDQRSRKAGEEQKEKDRQAFPDVKTGDVVGLTLVHAGGTVEAARTEGPWQLSAPVVTAGDGSALENLASAVVNLSYSSRIGAGELDPAAVDLTEPGTRVAARLKDGRTLHVWVGKKNTFNETVYVRAGEKPADAPVALVQGYSVSAMQKTAFDLRQKEVLPLSTQDVERLAIMVDGVPEAASFTAERTVKDGKRQYDDPWALTAPVAGPADRDEINKVLQALSAGRALAFPDETGADLGAYGLARPAFTVTVAGGGKSYGLVLGSAHAGAARKYYMKRADAPAVAEVTEQIFQALGKPLPTWRDKRIISFDQGALRGITAQLPGDAGGSLVLSRHVEDGGAAFWMVDAPRQGRARAWKASSLVYALASFKARSMVREDLPEAVGADVLQPYGLAPPARTVELRDGEGKVLAALLVGREEAGEFYVMARGGRAIGRVEKSKLDDLPQSVEDFLESKEEAAEVEEQE